VLNDSMEFLPVSFKRRRRRGRRRRRRRRGRH